MSVAELVAYSNKYGANPDFVLAGGGNTSWKTEDVLYIKGSGTALATITESGFVKMDRTALRNIFSRTYPADTAAREKMVLADLMDARLPGEEKKRPSVETLLHDLFVQKYILHVHPAIINGLTCSKNGQQVIAQIFPKSVWVEECEPGYVLAVTCREKMMQYREQYHQEPNLLFLENHGVFFAADSDEELNVLVEDVMQKVRAQTVRVPDFAPVETDASNAATVSPLLRMLYDADGHAIVRFSANAEILHFGASSENFENIRYPFTPDHIVYCKAEPLYLTSTEPQYVMDTYRSFAETRGFSPRVVFLQNAGMFAIGSDAKEALTVETVWTDALKIAAYAENFGGVSPMHPDLVDFIVHWEVESYRAKVHASGASAQPLNGKISIVTGSAQGFGAGIAEYLASQGAAVVVADMNAEGAEKEAQKIRESWCVPALAVAVNVSDEDSVKNMIEQTVLTFGGLDVFVNNAGIVRAGGLDEMTKSNFELVTAVNYTAYFLCVKYASVPMKIQRLASPSYMSDVIEINSKSGLAGSNKNFAYAGSKFGGIGLTQSFALELAPYGIKVNAICPGNFLDGPLWSDPDRGLFVQYLRAGKVPGAKTVEDVRAFYEAKVPLRRGCRTEDVACAVSYIINQKYETGQAIPVTGGQEMLN